MPPSVIPRVSAAICRAASRSAVARDFMTLRKKCFIDELGWPLREENGLEVDEFDRPDALILALYVGEICVGGWRAIRCDHPYLAQSIFPALATAEAYPEQTDCWEISRLCAMSKPESGVNIAMLVYGLMLRFAHENKIRALVAVTDLTHERLLKRIGIRTRRYGSPQIVDLDHRGQPIKAVAGEISMAAQDEAVLASLLLHTQHMDIFDEALVLGPQRVSA